MKFFALFAFANGYFPAKFYNMMGNDKVTKHTTAPGFELQSGKNEDQLLAI